MIPGEYSLKEVDSEELQELLAAESEPPPIESESAASAICGRIETLRHHALKQALPTLMLELERTARETLTAEERVIVMRCVKKPVLKAAAGLPKPIKGGDGGGAASITLEQRLLLLMLYNLRKTLHDVDRACTNRFADDDGDRIWVLQQMFRFFSRQIRYGIDWDRPWPPNTWRDLHDLFVYLVVRGMVQLSSDFSVSVFDEDFDAEIEYKRALLLGLTDRLTNRRANSEEFSPLLKRWATETRLQDPNSLVGQTGLIKVEVTCDEPPRLQEGALTESFRGWILRPPESFRDYIDHINFGTTT
ncbi:hypothetical protein [Thiospirillum jenense]|uniref:Uncharacterized protein n=1 Tax=Thiospirillum jenense TaxID=1653858 RepID=A0A839HPC6_9GAMM|nr:hypothetical protein [Thiospirillum jenense]MBB1127092.1 hypothetical protein [Thiospirillum jenense]